MRRHHFIINSQVKSGFHEKIRIWPIFLRYDTAYRPGTRQVDISLRGSETCNDALNDDSFGLRPDLAE
jgi:hypothetical protein